MRKKHFYQIAVGLCFLMTFESQGAPGWTQQTSHTKANLGGVHFINENTGFVAGDSGVVLKTKDGGTTWTRMFADTNGFMDIQALDTNLVFTSAWVKGKVFRTANSGTTWSEVETGKDSTWSAMGIWFTNSQTGFVCTGKSSPFPYSHSRILRTMNSGTTWDTVFSSNDWVSYLQFPVAGHGYATVGGSVGTVIKTIDSGATWTALSLNDSMYWMSGVYFLNKDTGYAGGVGHGMVNNTYKTKKIFKTIDGGSSWTAVNNNVTAIKLFFVNDSTGYLIGGDSMIINVSPPKNIRLMKTQNSGITWQRVDLDTNLNQNGFWFPSADVGYVAGDSGTIFKYQATTIAGGKTHPLKNAPVNIDVIAINLGKLQIRYSLSSQIVKEVTFTMYNVQGICIWRKQICGTHLTAGPNTIRFHIGPHLAAGMYVFSMSATSALSGKRTITEKVASWLP